MQAEELLAPVPGDTPTGQDLFEDPERQVIEQAFEESPGDVDWRATIGLIEQQFGRTKDVWLAVYLARAGAQMGRLDTIVTGCEALAGLFETYWDDLFPKLDEYGFQGRKGPCESLTKIGPFLGPLKRTVLVEHQRLGSYNGEDLIRFETEGDSADGFGMFRKAVEETSPDDLRAAVDRLDCMRDALMRADAVLMANADGDTGTDFKPTYETIDSIRRALLPYAGLGESAEEAAASPDSGNASESSGPRIAGRVDSREDVVKAIDAIAEYYQRREPGSPIPVALRRVRTWVSMDFMAILRDIAPNSISEAGAVLLSRPDEDSGGY
jgi:type VI secretion system protein ImpA